MLSWIYVKSLVATEIVQKIRFEGDWGELEEKGCF